MSGQEKLNKGRGDFLENCTIAELEALLNAAVQDIPEDEAYIAGLEAAILRCETECPTGRLSDPDEAWARFCGTRLDRNAGKSMVSGGEERPKPVASMDGRPRPRRTRRLGRVVLIAAVIVVMMTLLLPPVLGYRDIFHMVAHWTNEQFRFVSPAYGSPKTAKENSGQNVMTPLMESLEEYGLPISFAPSWFPEDRQLSEVQYRETGYGKTFYTAIFTDEDGEQLVYFKLIKLSQSVESQTYPTIWEKDNGEAIEFSYNGIIHYIITNSGYVGIHWYVDYYEAAIFGAISIDEAKAIVESIYER